MTIPTAARARRVNLYLFALLLLSYGYYFDPGQNWNSNSRLALVWSIVDDGTVRIDKYQATTRDIAYRDGHYYSDKAPGLSLLGVPVYWTLKHTIGPGLTSDQLQRVATQQINFWWNTMPTVILALLLMHFLALLGFSLTVRLWTTLAYALGSLVYPYATIVFGHQLAAVLGFVPFLIAYLVKRGQMRWPMAALFGAGLLAGWGVVVEYTNALIVLALVAYVSLALGGSMGDRVRRIAAFGMGVLPAAAALLTYNGLAFGHPFSIGYGLEAESAFAGGMGQGLFGVTWPPSIKVAAALLFGGYRGLFVYSPFLLLAAPAAVALWRRSAMRPEVLVSAFVVTGFLLFNASYYMWWGGAAIGPRFLVPTLPFLAWPVAEAIRRWRTLAMSLVGASLLLGYTMAATRPDGVEEHYAFPLVDTVLVRLIHGDTLSYMMVFLPRFWPHVHFALSLLPLAAGVLLLGGLLLRAAYGVAPTAAGARAAAATPAAAPATTGAAG